MAEISKNLVGSPLVFSLPEKYTPKKVETTIEEKPEEKLPESIREVLPELNRRELNRKAIAGEVIMLDSSTVEKVYGPYETGIQSKRDPENRKLVVHFKDKTKRSMKLSVFRIQFPDLAERLTKLERLS